MLKEDKTLDSLFEEDVRGEYVDGSKIISLDLYKRVIKDSRVFSNPNNRVNGDGQIANYCEYKGMRFVAFSPGPLDPEDLS